MFIMAMEALSHILLRKNEEVVLWVVGGVGCWVIDGFLVREATKQGDKPPIRFTYARRRAT